MDSFYTYVKDSHNIFRWLILGIAVLTIVKYLLGWLGKRQFGSSDNILSLIYTILLDLQLMMGLVLYFLLSPTTTGLFKGTGDLSDAHVRFFAIEHPAAMFMGIVCAHVGRIASKKANNDQSKFLRGAIWFGLSLLLILARMPWQTGQ